MTTFVQRRANGGRHWIRRAHRWIGAVAAIFLILLAVTGIALNHSEGWKLDRHYVSWTWLLDAYGIHAPAPSASFADKGYRATLVSATLYFQGRPVAENAAALTGLAVVEPIAVAGLDDAVLVMTVSGDVVERIDLSSQLGGRIQRVGRTGTAFAVAGGDRLLVSDAEVTAFQVAAGPLPENSVAWPQASAPSAAELETLNEVYRGRGLTAERLIADIHSGRIATAAGRLVMDVVAILLVLLSASGLVLWARRGRRDAGNGGYR